MKFLTVLLLSFVFTSLAQAGSFQQMIDEQQIVTISPVEFEGKPVVSVTRKGLQDAVLLCSTLGFQRTVDAELELRDFETVAKWFS